MKKTIFLLILLIFFAQYSLLSMIGGAKNISQGILLTLLLVVFLRRNYLENIGWALFGGLLTDYFSSVPFGFNVINFTVLVFAMYVLKQKIALKEMHFSIVAFVVFLGLILSNLLAMSFSSILSVVKITAQISSIDFSVQFIIINASLAIIGFLFYRLVLIIEKVFGIGAMEIKIDKL
ncbi:hypothetical protein HN784_02460 [bacterium]|nr:hypothetical protein [bacterium]